MNYCKHLKRRKNKPYCNLLKIEISFSQCWECNDKEIKYKIKKPMKLRSNKLARKEKRRFSIIYTDLSKCCVCGLKTGIFDSRLGSYTQIEKNEVFSGAYRSVSIEDGMVMPLCIFCHKQFHKDSTMNLKFKIKFQKEYLKTHTLENFISRYGQNYMFKLSQKKDGKDI